MRFLLDTNIAVWAKTAPARLSARARSVLVNEEAIAFSVVSIWEVVIKVARQKAGFAVDARLLRRRMLDDGFVELNVTADHALAVADLPAVHGDPFDRLLLAQARAEGLSLLTSDRLLARYGSGVALVD